MKKFAFKSIAVILFVSSSLISCSNDDSSETVILQNEFVTSVTAPETGTIDQDIEMTVKFLIDNPCGQFNKFTEVTTGNTKTIQVQAKYIGSDCGSNSSEVSVPYKFRVNQAGTYTFKFKKNDSQFLTKVVTVE